MKYLLIADTHFGHKNIQKYCNRPDGWEQTIIGNWIKSTDNDTTTIHLGDFIFGPEVRGAEILSGIGGKKILIKGNHDRRSNASYIRQGFDIVLQSMIMENIIFSHHPVDIDMLNQVYGIQADINIHGHFHDAFSKPDFQLPMFKQKYPFYGENHRLFALEYTNYMPVELREFISLPQVGT